MSGLHNRWHWNLLPTTVLLMGALSVALLLWAYRVTLLAWQALGRLYGCLGSDIVQNARGGLEMQFRHLRQLGPAMGTHKIACCLYDS